MAANWVTYLFTGSFQYSHPSKVTVKLTAKYINSMHKFANCRLWLVRNIFVSLCLRFIQKGFICSTTHCLQAVPGHFRPNNSSHARSSVESYPHLQFVVWLVMNFDCTDVVHEFQRHCSNFVGVLISITFGQSRRAQVSVTCTREKPESLTDPVRPPKNDSSYSFNISVFRAG